MSCKMVIGAWVLAALLTACGGGGGGSGGGGGASAPGGGGSGNPPATPAANVQSITVEEGPANFVNALFTSVTLCIPGTTTCQTVDHVLVDSGSSGLRIVSEALNDNMVLPTEMDSGKEVVECTQFADGFTWGPVKIADIRISGERAAAVPIQVIGDPDYPVIPNNCTNTGPPENTVETFGGNGLLGVGLFKQDCGTSCLSNGNAFYYACPCQLGSTSTALALDLQVQNPVAIFDNDNNGVLIQLPSVPDEGAVSVSGSLVFGIGTQTNNGLGSTEVYTVKPNTGTFFTTYKGQVYTQSVLDSGSAVNFFADAGIHICNQPQDVASGFYCPDTTLDLSADVAGKNGVIARFNFQVANAHDLFTNNPSHWAFKNLAAPDIVSSRFIWGLPTFMGRNVFIAIEGQNTPGGAGPYFAF